MSKCHVIPLPETVRECPLPLRLTCPMVSCMAWPRLPHLQGRFSCPSCILGLVPGSFSEPRDICSCCSFCWEHCFPSSDQTQAICFRVSPMSPWGIYLYDYVCSICPSHQGSVLVMAAQVLLFAYLCAHATWRTAWYKVGTQNRVIEPTLWAPRDTCASPSLLSAPAEPVTAQCSLV